MKQVLFSIGLLLLLVGCARPDDTDGPIDVSRVKFLMDGKWTLTGHMVYLGGDMTNNVDGFPLIEECIRDNYYVFTSPNDVQMWQGPQKCVPSDADVYEYYYRLSNNENEMHMFADAFNPDESILMRGQIEYPAYNTFHVKFWVEKDLVIQTYTRSPIEE